MSANEIVVIVTSLLGGGALASIVTVLANRNKTKADAFNSQITGLLNVDGRVHQRLTDLEDRNQTLRERLNAVEDKLSQIANEKVTISVENTRLKETLTDVEAKLAALAEEYEELRQENNELKAKISRMELELKKYERS